MVYIRLSGTSNVPSGDLKQFSVEEKEILVVNLNGQFFCLDARCTHAGAPLAEGELNKEVLTCPWHGSQFNITNGLVLKGPAQRPLNVYRLVIKEDSLFVEV